MMTLDSLSKICKISTDTATDSNDVDHDIHYNGNNASPMIATMTTKTKSVKTFLN